MKKKYNKSLRNSIVVAGLLTFLLVGNEYRPKKNISINLIDPNKLSQRLEEKSTRTSLNNLIRDKLTKDYSDFISKNQGHMHFSKRIKKAGLERTVKHIAGLEFYSVDLAEEYAKSRQTIPEKEYIQISKKIVVDEENFFKDFADEKAKNVEDARLKVIEIKTQYYKKLFTENNPDAITSFKNYDELVRSVYTKEEYTDYCLKLANARADFLDEIGVTLGKLIHFGGKDVLNKMKKIEKEHYLEVRDKIYSEKLF